MADEVKDTRSAEEIKTDDTLARIAQQWGGGEHKRAAERLAAELFPGRSEAEQRALLVRADDLAPGIREAAKALVINDAPRKPKPK